MEINWKNLEDLTYLPKAGMWRSGKYKYYKHVDFCTLCGESFLQRIDQEAKTLKYCSRICQMSCGKQRKKQGESLSASWKDPNKRKHMTLNTEKAVMAWQQKRREEVSLLDKDRKICSVCEKEMSIKSFTKDARLLTGLSPTCKYCKRDQYKKWVLRDGIQEFRNEYMRNKEKVDPKFKLRRRISTAVYQSIIGDKNGMGWEFLVGYRLKDLKKHLEKQFQPGVTWENYGEWHIDHKIPVAAFNFTRPEHEDFKRCWALGNLQPLWASDNCSKCAKLLKPFQPRLQLEVVNAR